MMSVSLNPNPGFCIKTTTLQPSQNLSIPIPKGYKIFVNICYDPHVPPPPEGSEEAIQRAMNGAEMDDSNPDAWFVPVIVSSGLESTDKAGKPCLVFDCVFHKSVKSRTLRDPEFKVFIIELSLQRTEAQTQLVLSRQIGTPNIAAKGKLQPRTVSIPSILAPTKDKPAEIDTSKSNSGSMKKPLIEEIMPHDPSGSAPKTPKGILKSSSKEPIQASAKVSQAPVWSWSRSGSGQILIQIEVPALEKSVVSLSNLDIEPRRLILSIPNYPVLDLNLSLSDAELVARSGKGSTIITDLGTAEGKSDDSAVDKLLALKRQRPFYVEGATAEWIMADNKLLITV
ncbi:hypothetical protein GYMLUDRAFT_48498 [Collybiopsis luxurians FD-317 M1]|uniref:PIH1 N-terminal domain-containing protein n=1 Tax=Collybiopsis luxurians FD-317 M1 TaxID=944289 RepID=A0A0D0CI26_9AGAR|nr:hypothetical protein GYMLUDRAFT_48498 [Collybiopsis luxurians FD-317 M1]